MGGGRLKKIKQGGFTLVESIVIVVLAVGIIFAIYHFGWGVKEPAGETALEAHLDTMQKAVDLYMFDSNGLYPTDDGELPARGEDKLIVWSADFTLGGKQLVFYPDYLKRKPGHWDEGIWRINSVGIVSIDINPEDY
jgi:competence protein ComGC